MFSAMAFLNLLVLHFIWRRIQISNGDSHTFMHMQLCEDFISGMAHDDVQNSIDLRRKKNAHTENKTQFNKVLILTSVNILASIVGPNPDKGEGLQ